MAAAQSISLRSRCLRGDILSILVCVSIINIGDSLCVVNRKKRGQPQKIQPPSFLLVAGFGRSTNTPPLKGRTIGLPQLPWWAILNGGRYSVGPFYNPIATVVPFVRAYLPPTRSRFFPALGLDTVVPVDHVKFHAHYAAPSSRSFKVSFK